MDVAVDEYAEFHEQDGEAKIKIDALYEDVKVRLGVVKMSKGHHRQLKGGIVPQCEAHVHSRPT